MIVGVVAILLSVVGLMAMPRERDLNYWTGYYAMRMNVQVIDVRFDREQRACARFEHRGGNYVDFNGAGLYVFDVNGSGSYAVDLDGSGLYVVTYSTRPLCNLASPKKRARRELCLIRMGPNSPPRNVAECDQWYDAS
jgi:hypothetical protein